MQYQFPLLDLLEDSALSIILKILVLTVPLLLGVAFLVLAERKVLASMQRRKGPNVVGIFGVQLSCFFVQAMDMLYVCFAISFQEVVVYCCVFVQSDCFIRLRYLSE